MAFSLGPIFLLYIVKVYPERGQGRQKWSACVGDFGGVFSRREGKLQEGWDES